MQQKRIIFYRSGAIGDIMHCLPTLQACKVQNPEASIEIVIANKQVTELLREAAGYIDKVWNINHKGPFNKLFSSDISSDEQALIDSLKQNPADEFIYLHTNFIKPMIFNWQFFKASKVIRYKRDDKLSAVENYAQVYFGKVPELEPLCLALSDKQVPGASTSVDTPKSPYICVVPGVGKLRPHRAYPLDKWMDFIRNAIETNNLHVKILGGPDEMELSEIIKQCSIISKQPDHIENLIGKTSILELAQILDGAEHIYSADTGILHIASALSKPVTSMFSITSEKRFGPFNPNAKVLRSKSCTCEAGKSNRPKHCSNLKDGFAACMYGIELC